MLFNFSAKTSAVERAPSPSKEAVGNGLSLGCENIALSGVSGKHGNGKRVITVCAES